MPIEVYPGKTGPRLIPVLPISEGSYALIYYVDPSIRECTLQATYQGAQSNGYPVLSPVLDTLPASVSSIIEQERSREIRDAERYLDDARYVDTATEEIAELKAVTPLLSSIKVGASLSVVVNSLLPTTRYLLGVVTKWEIFNT